MNEINVKYVCTYFDSNGDYKEYFFSGPILLEKNFDGDNFKLNFTEYFENGDIDSKLIELNKILIPQATTNVKFYLVLDNEERVLLHELPIIDKKLDSFSIHTNSTEMGQFSELLEKYSLKRILTFI